MPLDPRRDGCAAITRRPGGQWGPPCDQLPTVRAIWRFDKPGPTRILLCAEHAAELAGEERQSDVVRYYDAAVEDVTASSTYD